MTIYIIDGTGIINGPVELPVIPGLGIQLPGNAIELPEPLPEPSAGHVWALVEGTPTQLADHRGTVFSTATGVAHQHDQLGELPPELTTEPRPSADHLWNGGAWVFDSELAARNREALTVTLCARIDASADTARARVAGDPLRAVEYDRAASEAQAFAAADYQGDVPPMVAAWAIGGRTGQEAADDILREAAQYTAALVVLRETRLAAKEQVRILMAAGEVEQAQQVVEQTVAAIEAAVAGIGNNG
ncbi:hypothetical protein [Stutzerimonas stutzeri]|uniref:hypothetical protein n=1 Tax=Stutzerimonas stutzeri TaxID=316 RepID=UPI00210B65FD|nr:hypothetical protein [Stutzerimonas stutzeri]MCQ4242483.1 hypothetical protein [Stutzerimonas stutzeri]